MSAALVKVIGLFYKIPLIKLVGVGGMAYYLAAFHIYTLFFTLLAAGFPVAVSIIVSAALAKGDVYASEKTYRISSGLFTLLGTVASAMLYFGADIAAGAIEIPEAATAIRAVAPSMVFVAAGSAVKGWFQGQGNMRPTAVSQIIESLGKTVFGLIFTGISVGKGDSEPRTAACAILGMTVGVVISTLYLFIIRGVKKPKNVILHGEYAGTGGTILKKLVSLSFPVMLGSLVINLSGFADTAMIPSRLRDIGYAPAVANTIYSTYGNLAIPLFNLVPAFISPIAVAAAPMITEAIGVGNRERERELLTSSVRICAIVAIPASFGIGVFGKEILGVIFSGENTAVGIAAPLISILAPAVLFACLITVTNAVLQAYGRAELPVISMTVGVSVKLISEYFLVGDPDINIAGAPISTLLCDLTVVLLNFIFISKFTCGIDDPWRLFGKPLAAATAALVLTVTAATLIDRSMPNKYVIFPIIVIDVLLFAVFSCFFGALTYEDTAVLPGGDKIGKILRKIKLLH